MKINKKIAVIITSILFGGVVFATVSSANVVNDLLELKATPQANPQVLVLDSSNAPLQGTNGNYVVNTGSGGD